MAKKKIAVLTSGGDSPGMNATVRAVVRTSIYFGMDVYGVRRGYAGLLEKDIYKMDLRSVTDIIDRGGTILRSSRSHEFNSPEGVKAAVQILKDKKFSGLVVIGGDGSFRGALDLVKEGFPCIGIPSTIDNDIGCSEYTIGFDTAINTAMEMTDRIRDTTESHDRCSVVEVMGRKCGDLAIHTAMAVGAFSVLVPEMPYDFQRDIVDRMLKAKESGKKHFIIVVAEGVGHTEEIAKKIETETGFEARATILGHVQRGGTTTQKDRVMAGLMGYRAVLLLKNGEKGRIVAVRNGEVTDYEISEALAMKRVFDQDMYQITLRLSI